MNAVILIRSYALQSLLAIAIISNFFSVQFFYKNAIVFLLPANVLTKALL